MSLSLRREREALGRGVVYQLGYSDTLLSVLFL